MLAFIVLALVVIAIVSALANSTTTTQPNLIDGYTVHIRLQAGETPQTFDAHIEVELGAEDGSTDPQYVLARRALALPMSYDVLRGTIHQRVRKVTDSKAHAEAQRMVAFAKMLAVASRETREELFQSVLRDDGERRLRSLLDLLRQFPRAEVTKRAASAAVIDEHPAVRLHAAMFLDEEGLDIVEAIVCDESTPMELRLQGLRHRSRGWRSIGYGALLERLLSAPEVELREAAIYAFAESEAESTIDRLMAMLTDAQPRIAEAIARSLGRKGATRAEPALLALLDRPEEEVLIAAAQALSRVGSTAALGRLVYASRRESLQEITRDVLLAAVEVLKDDRRPNAGGHLSVVADVAEARGGLSLEHRASALSYPEDDN